jgi:hypothetical protein
MAQCEAPDPLVYSQPVHRSFQSFAVNSSQQMVPTLDAGS